MTDIAVEDTVDETLNDAEQNDAEGDQPRIVKKEGNWTCECGNENYWDRAVCNMRSCQKRNPALGPKGPRIDGWTCVECGNNNYADRTECNMRHCRAPRDSRQARPAFQHAYRPGMGRDIRYKPVSRGPYDRHDDFNRIPDNANGSSKDGNWICKCGNDNFGDREFCNLRKCRLPRPQQRYFGSQRRDGGRYNNGDWTCECGNVNFADRMFCNMRKCGLPKKQGDMRQGSRRFEERLETYRPSGPMRSGASRPSKNMWVCECGNENFEDREICNMRKCGRPKPAGGLRAHGRDKPTGSAALRDRDGNIKDSWTCECGNQNYADRNICNMRKCGLPRPAEF